MVSQEILLESGTNELELLTFVLGNQSFGLNVLKVQSIQQYDSSALTKIPMAHHAMLGMILYRDKTIPLIDLHAALDLKNKYEAGDKWIVIVTEFNNVVNGFLVNDVNRIYRLNWENFIPLDRVVGSCVKSITGSIRIDDTDIMVVDLEYILSVISPNLAISDINDETANLSSRMSREEVQVFFAEDSITIRSNVIRILEKAGYKNVRSFEDGQQAYDALVALRDQVDTNGSDMAKLPHVLISDIEMPQLDGLSLCKKIKTDIQLDQIIVIMFSSLINTQMLFKCKSVGADNSIAKPEMNRLVAMLDELCLDSSKVFP
ncbi:MAG: chemotaxis protein [Candidatus Scalindua rubra]|uniref:CheW like chemotaxis response regulatory protein n=1 Tax=Candidatus Scalindua brodae TaxID=237368 RepID=A0A0B0EJF0_9BACT|nr:MAG: CheW like chemotaxis response regulatory protein [Candidatus Scalindua brodae]MBZ0108668.1 chemotaxis protein [Candidatus Scalindua rubra]TWU37968.1 Chemotaxis protein CheV [Candidatus Brocadiaceae bacterium S225]